MHVEFYLSNKKLIDSLLEDPTFATMLSKYGIVQSFTTKILCKKYNICDICHISNISHKFPASKNTKNTDPIFCADMSHLFYKYAIIPPQVELLIHSIFHYMFDIVRKGIYVYIKDGNIRTFLPFSNDRGQGGQDGQGGQGGQNVSAVFLELITELCYARNIPDVCFFINVYDYPVLKKNRYHPRDKLYPQNKLPNLGLEYSISDAVPIFSQSTTNKHDDVLVPKYKDIVMLFCTNKVTDKTVDKVFTNIQNKLKVCSEKQENMNIVTKKGLIIIPFRDSADHLRQKQLDKTLAFFDDVLNPNLLEYRVIKQPHDNKLFNRGLLLNTGIDKNPADYYILHDADLIPDKALLEQYYQYPVTPIHLGYRGQRWSGSDNKKFIGGILSINKYDFYRANGFPNDFWGWGGEDDALSTRLQINGIQVSVPLVGSVTDLENLTVEQKLAGLKSTGQKNQIKREQLARDKKTWHKNGIRQLG